MRYGTWILGMAAAVILSLGISCENTDVTGTGGTTGNDQTYVPDSLSLASTFPALLANGTDHITVLATVVNARGKPIPGTTVRFYTSHGTIDSRVVADASGIAHAVLTSVASTEDVLATVTARTLADSLGGAPLGYVFVTRKPLTPSVLAQALSWRSQGGVSAITPSSGEIQGAALSRVIEDAAQVPMTGVTLALTANPATIPADGITSTRVVASVMETTRKIPIPGESVRFGTTAGAINGNATTDETGAATATLMAHPGETGATVTAYYGSEMTATSTVTFSPLTLSLAAGSSTLIANGASSTTVTARLVNQSGNPVPGASISFGASLGTLASPVVTDVDGKASTTLSAGTEAGTAHITARFGGVLSQSLDVTFAVPPTTAHLLFHSDVTALPADGAAEATLTATALDAQDNPMLDGTPVTFTITSGSGRIIGPVALTDGGVAEARYVAGTSAGAVSIQASSGSAQATIPLMLTSLQAGTMTLATTNATLLANGLAMTTITAVVTDAFGHPVAAGTTVDFTASAGVLEDATPTDASGTATVKLHSQPLVTGLSRVTAKAGELQGTVDVRFVSEAAAHIEAIGAEPPRIGVLGTSDDETANITFEVQDASGIPVDADHAVTLTFTRISSGNPTDATLYPDAARTNERGRVGTTVNAGHLSGVVEILATTGQVSSEPVQVAIHGDLPDPNHFSIASSRLNIAGLVYYGIRTPATAYVSDSHGNPVPEGTAVWFYSAFGGIQGSDVTDDHGEATVDQITESPAPAIPGGNGLVQICARTVAKDGTNITACTNVMWSGPTIVEITNPSGTFNVPNGGSVTITYKVRDANNNPLVGGTTINVATTAGALSGDTSVTLPDTQDRAYTTFQVVLSDDDPGSNQAAAATVTVSVESQNGNGTASLTGTVN